MDHIPKALYAPEPSPALDATGSICMTTYVHGAYQDYIPVYIYSTLLSYPDYFVRIFLRETLAPHNRRALDAIRSGLSDRFEIRENACTDLDGFILRGARWLLPYEELADFEYAYIGDVDYIICRESPDIRARHVGYCRELNLPYSNSVRVKNPADKKLTGLHFIIVKPYYKKMADVIDNTRKRIQQDSEHPYNRINNENMLYEIVEQGIGRFPPKWFRPGHGIHLGAIRGNKDLKLHNFPHWSPFVIGEMLQDPVFREVKRHMGKNVRREVLRTQALCGRWWNGFR